MITQAKERRPLGKPGLLINQDLHAAACDTLGKMNRDPGQDIFRTDCLFFVDVIIEDFFWNRLPILYRCNNRRRIQCSTNSYYITIKMKLTDICLIIYCNLM